MYWKMLQNLHIIKKENQSLIYFSPLLLFSYVEIKGSIFLGIFPVVLISYISSFTKFLFLVRF